MLEILFEQVISCSITASYVIVSVMIARFFLRKAPKSYSYALWMVVFFRLLCPITFESSFGMLPPPKSNLSLIENNKSSVDVITIPKEHTEVKSEESVVLTTISPEISSEIAITSVESVGLEQKSLLSPLLLWCTGVGIFSSFTLISVRKLRKKLQISLRYHKNIYLVDSIDTPFVWGLWKPRIYLPSHLSEEQKVYVTAHEAYHIKRFDHITRFLAFFALVLHWFNPLVWLAFVLSGRDMELSVDENVVKLLMKEEKIKKDYKENVKSKIQKNYATSLLELGVKQNSFAILYVAPTFGRSETKERIKNIMNMKKTKLWVSGFSSVLVLGLAVGFAMEQPETGGTTLFSVFSQEKTEVLPTELELFGGFSWVNQDVNAVNELSKVFRIAVATLEDWEKSIGTTVTWHTTATNGINVTTNEPEGNNPIQKEIDLTLGVNGKSLGAAESEWGKASDITLILGNVDNGVPYIYTENESVAYHLIISTSPDDPTAIPESDPNPSMEEEQTMYEYYAFMQDIAAMESVLEEFFYLLVAEMDDFTIGDTLSWTLDRNTPSKFVVNQQNGKTIQGYVDEVLAHPTQHNIPNIPYDLPSASEILKEVDVTFEVAQSVDGSLFLFTEDQLISTIFSIPVNEKEEFNRIEVDHSWLLIKNPSDDWWKTGIASKDMEIDFSAAREILKISRIFVAQSNENPDGVTVTWHTDLPEDTQKPRLTVTGENESFRAYLENELYYVLGSGGSLIGFPISEEAKGIPFSFTINTDIDGVPQFMAHDDFWANPLDIPLLEA